MITRISDIIHEWTGWCPNSPALDVQKPRISMSGLSGITDPEPPQPQMILTRIATPPWMTAIALAILFATFFVGGNIWWPAIVLAVLVIFVIIHIRSVQTQRRA